MHDYTEAGGKGKTTIDQEEAVEALLKQYEVVAAMFHGFDYSAYFTGKPADRVRVIPAAIDFIEKRERQETRGQAQAAVPAERSVSVQGVRPVRAPSEGNGDP